MRDTLEAIAQTVGEVVSREDLPVWGAHMRRLLRRYTVGCEIPHLRIAVGNVLLHAKKGRARLIFSISHILELLHIGFDVLVGMFAAESRSFLSVLPTTLKLDLLLATMTYVRLFSSDELYGQLI